MIPNFICHVTYYSDWEHLDELGQSPRNLSRSLSGESGRVTFVNQWTLCRPLLDGCHPSSHLPLLLHLASAARAESRWHPDGTTAGVILRDAVKDPGRLCLLALPPLILN